jgi:hypothetical protein
MSEADWNQRVLCPDGACTGLIGPDGTCKVCGHMMPNWGDERMRGIQPDPDEDVDADAEPSDDDVDDEADEADDDGDEDGDEEDDADGDEVAANAAPGEWTERKLCDDGACVGVIASDGTCTVCGKRSAA